METLINYFLSTGAVTSGVFIAYLIYQSQQDRKEREEERKTRVDEKNQFINILQEIRDEIKEIKFHTKK